MSKSPQHRRESSPFYRSTAKFAQRARVKSADFAQRATANTVDFAQRATVNSVDFAQRATANSVDLAQRAAATTAKIAQKHSRVSAIAAAAAAAGMLGAAGFAAGAAPWSQAIDNVAHTVVGGSQPTSGQLGANLFAVITGTTTVKPATQLDSINTSITVAGAHYKSAKDVATATATAVKRQPVKTGSANPESVKAQPVKAQAAVKAQPAKAQPTKAQPAKATPAKPKAAAAPAKPYTIYDSVTPSSIPSGQPAAVYANGNYAASSSQVAGHQSVLWIDTNGSDPNANVLDVEPGDATPAGAAQWVQERLNANHNAVAVVYTMMSDWQQVKADVAALPAWMQSKVQYWIADPTGVPHVVPGSSATQWYWGTNYDLTTATPGFTK